jgi:hypothetical protein
MVKMVLAASQTQATSVSSKSTATVQAYENLIQSLQLFVNEEQLKSMAYDNAKSYYNSVLIPFVKASILLTEAVAEACQKFTDTYQAEVDSCDLDSEVLERQINEAQIQINRLEAIWRENSLKDIPDNIKGNQLFQNGQTMERIFNMKTMLQDKLNKLLQFEASSPQLFANISNLKAIVEKGKVQTAGAWNGNSFTLPADLSWTGTVGASWQLRDKRLKGIDDQKVEELKEYTIYAVVYYDLDGNPKVMWQLEKDGKGLKNPELYQYLDKAGVYLDSDMFEFMDYDSWNTKIKDGWRNGYNYVTGETYNPLLGGLVAGSQYAEDVYTWINETDIGIALQTLGFTYATYRMATQNGSVTVDKKANGLDDTVDLYRRTQNIGEYQSLEELMELKHVKSVAKDAGIGLDGVKIRIERDPSLIGRELFGYASPDGKTITLYPDAFTNKEILVKTLGHERMHIYQVKNFGPPLDFESSKLYEAGAWGSEKDWWNYYNYMNGGN